MRGNEYGFKQYTVTIYYDLVHMSSFYLDSGIDKA